MTIDIDEAIKVLEKERKEHHSFSTDIIGKAEQLGIEALKRIVYLRKDMDCPHYMQLPGETDE